MFVETNYKSNNFPETHQKNDAQGGTNWIKCQVKGKCSGPKKSAQLQKDCMNERNQIVKFVIAIAKLGSCIAKLSTFLKFLLLSQSVELGQNITWIATKLRLFKP